MHERILLILVVILASSYFFIHPHTQFKQSAILGLQSSQLLSCYTQPENSIQAEDSTIIQHGRRDEKKIALTFDADMTPGMKDALLKGRVSSWYNKEIINILHQTNTPATLFLTGMWIELYPNETKELASDPLFELENHSYSHPSFHGSCYGLTAVSKDQMEEEVTKTRDLLKQVAGVENKYFRFPGGCYSDEEVKMVNKLGLLVVHWDTVGNDGFNDDFKKIEQNVLSQAQNGSIIVLHMHGGSNAPVTHLALPTVISELKSKGYTFVKLEDLL